jgi:hypothetical protein
LPNFVRKRDKEGIQGVFLPPEHSLNVLISLLSFSRHSGLEFDTSTMHVGACVLQKLEK